MLGERLGGLFNKRPRVSDSVYFLPATNKLLFVCLFAPDRQLAESCRLAPGKAFPRYWPGNPAST